MFVEPLFVTQARNCIGPNRLWVEADAPGAHGNGVLDFDVPFVGEVNGSPNGTLSGVTVDAPQVRTLETTDVRAPEIPDLDALESMYRRPSDEPRDRGHFQDPRARWTKVRRPTVAAAARFVPLAGILILQGWNSAVLITSNTAFLDEATYLGAGHRLFQNLLHGGANLHYPKLLLRGAGDLSPAGVAR